MTVVWGHLLCGAVFCCEAPSIAIAPKSFALAPPYFALTRRLLHSRAAVYCTLTPLSIALAVPPGPPLTHLFLGFGEMFQ